MKSNEVKFSKELSEIISDVATIADKNGYSEITLESVIYEILKIYLDKVDGKEGQDPVFKEFIKGLTSNPTRTLTQVKKFVDRSVMKSFDKDLSVLKTEIPSSMDLNDTISRAIKSNEMFKSGQEIEVSDFFLSALHCEFSEMMTYLKDKGLTSDMLLTNLKWSEKIEEGGPKFDFNGRLSVGTEKDEADFIKMAKLKLKELTGIDIDATISGSDFESQYDEDKDSSKDKKSSEIPSDEDFQKAGQLGSVRTKKIDPNSPTPFLDEFAFDMTKAAKDGKYDPVVGRDREVGSLIEILACRKKNNAILLGEPGCGKTSVVEALVEKIAKKEVPYALQNKRIVSLDLNALVAGAMYRGEYEKRLQGIIKEVVETKGIIVFIDEVHNLIGNGSSSGQGDGANILKPYLARGEFQIIGATTKTEYRIIEKDGALKRRFQNVVVEDPGINETIGILKTVSEKYSNYHGVKYTDEVITSCVKWSDKYISDRHQPDKSIDIMDMAGSLCKLRKPVDTAKEKELRKEIEAAIDGKVQAVHDKNFELAAEYRDKEKQLMAQLENFKQGILEGDKDKSKWPEVSIDDIADVISKITNIPVDKIKSTDTVKIKELKESLLTNIIGQDHAIDAVIKTLQLGVLGIRDPKRPLCSFLLCGPSGVGKTYLAKLLAKYYFGNENAIVRINMGEMDEHSKARLLGSQPGTIGYDEPTPFDDLATRPASVVLLDEVEKADAKIFDVILNAIGEEGYITLNNGKDISFRQSIVILTSNIGTRELQAKGDGLGFSKETGEDKKKSDSGTVMKAIKKFFRPEFLNRLTGISVFNELGKEDMMKIFNLELDKMNDRMRESGHIINVSDKVKTKIIDSVDTKFGARDLTRKIMELVSNNVCEEMVKAGDKVKKNIFVDLKKDEITVKFKK